jgi:hypothetical protein
MLKKWQFTDVPISVVPSSLNDALYVLLDEELILRRDPPSGPSIFSPSGDTINFPFDEFRDFLSAQYLLHSIYVTDRSPFEQYIARGNGQSGKGSFFENAER